MLLIWMSGSLLDARILACARKTTFLMTFGAALAHALTYEEEQVYNVLKVLDLKDNARLDLLKALKIAVCSQHQAISLTRWVDTTCHIHQQPWMFHRRRL